VIWALVGHRGTGKSELGRRAAEILNLPFIDLDEKIEKDTGRSPLSWIEESEESFRALEIRMINDLAEPAVVAPGAGIRTIPARFAVVWIARIGWEEKARGRKPAIRPDLSAEGELS
jgi:shikimate kinase